MDSIFTQVAEILRNSPIRVPCEWRKCQNFIDPNSPLLSRFLMYCSEECLIAANDDETPMVCVADHLTEVTNSLEGS